MPTLYRLTLSGQLLGQLVETVLHFEGRGTGGSMEELAQVFDAFHNATWRQFQSTGVTYSHITVAQASTPTPMAYQIPTTGKTGQMNGDVGAPQLAVVIGLRSPYTDRKKNGRIFLPGYTNTRFAGGQLTDAGMTELGIFSAALLSNFGPDIVNNPYCLGVLSRSHLRLHAGDYEGAWTRVQQIRVSKVLGTIRRRRIGTGA